MTVGQDWTPHRRADRELVGWIRPQGALWVGVDVLGRDATAPMDWLDAEAALEARGIAWLADIWMLAPPDADDLRVKIVEVTPARVVVQTDDYGAIDVPVTRIVLPWPAPDTLRPLTRPR
jgi:hypothetical protein